MKYPAKPLCGPLDNIYPSASLQALLAPAIAYAVRLCCIVRREKSDGRLTREKRDLVFVSLCLCVFSPEFTIRV